MDAVEAVVKTAVTAAVAAGVAIAVDRVAKIRSKKEEDNLRAQIYNKAHERGYYEGRESIMQQFGQQAEQYAQDFTRQ